MDGKYVIYIQEQDVKKLGSEFMEDKKVGINYLTMEDVKYWFKRIFGRKPTFSLLTKAGGGKRKSHKKKRKSKRKSRKSRKFKKTKRRRR